MEWGENILCLQFVQAYWLVASYLSHSQSFTYLLNSRIPVILLLANLCSFSFRYLYTQWWLGQGGNCSFRGQWGETLEVAFGGKLLGVDEIRSSWYGQHWWSSRWCYHCCSLLEAGIWSEHYFFFCLIWVVQWLVLIVIHAFQGLFLLYLNFCLSLIFVVFLFLIL